MKSTIRTENAGKTTRLTVSGKLDEPAVQNLTEKVWQADGEGTDAIGLDLSGVTAMDSGGMKGLFKLKDVLGRRLRIHVPPDGEEGWPVRRAGAPRRRLRDWLSRR